MQNPASFARTAWSNVIPVRRVVSTCEACPRFDVVSYKILELAIDLGAYDQRNRAIGTAVQFSRMVVGIEEIHAEFGDRKGSRFAGARRTGNHDHSWNHLSAEIAISTFSHVFRNIVTDPFSVLVNNPPFLQLVHRFAHPPPRSLKEWLLCSSQILFW